MPMLACPREDLAASVASDKDTKMKEPGPRGQAKDVDLGVDQDMGSQRGGKDSLHFISQMW